MKTWLSGLGKGTIRPLLTFSIDGVYLFLEVYTKVNGIEANLGTLGSLAMVATIFWFGGRTLEKQNGNA